MVFQGKLSRGCSSCRKVHVKCDEGRPTCSRCARLRKICAGYREPLDLMFRHIAFTDEDKPKIQQKKSRPDEESKTLAPLQLSPAFAPSKVGLALAFFYTNTLENLPESDHARYLHTNLSSLYVSSRPQSALHLAALAISHVVYSRYRRHDCQLLQSSRKFYVQAISAINIALRDPIEAVTNATLYAVLLLCGYETSICDAQSLTAWGSHIDGAIALLTLRGRENLTSTFSRKMYYFTRRSSILSHMQTARPIDAIFTELADSEFGDENAEDRLLSNTIHIPRLQSLANSLLKYSSYHNRAHVLDLLDATQNLDRQLIAWANHVPASWRYTTSQILQPQADSRHKISDYVPSHTHAYSDIFVARVWNMYRVSRLILQSIILRATSWLSEDSTIDQSGVTIIDAENTTRILVDNICSSVPFLLGYQLRTKNLTPQSPILEYWNLWPQNSLELTKSTMNGKFSLIWPLHVASSVIQAPRSQRNWIMAQICWLGEAGDIPQANLVAERGSQTLYGGTESFRFDCV